MRMVGPTKTRLLEQQPGTLRRLQGLLGAFAVGVLLLGATTPAWAYDEATKAEALQRYQVGKGYYEQHQYLEAAKAFQLALQQLPLPILALWAARCYDLAGDWVSSQAIYVEATRLTPNDLWLGDKQQRAQSNAARELDQLSKRIEAERQKAAKESIVPAAQADAIEAPPQAVHATAAASPWRTVGWVSLSVGAAALTVGTVTGLMLESRHSEMQPDCPQGICNPDSITRVQVDAHNNLRVASSIGFVAGGLLGAVGLTLILATPSQESKSEVALRLNPHGPMLEGVF